MVKNLPANAGDEGWIPRSRRFPGEEDDNPFQHFCLGSPKDRGAWQARVHGVTKSQTRLSDYRTTPKRHKREILAKERWVSKLVNRVDWYKVLKSMTTEKMSIGSRG